MSRQHVNIKLPDDLVAWADKKARANKRKTKTREGHMSSRNAIIEDALLKARDADGRSNRKKAKPQGKAA